MFGKNKQTKQINKKNKLKKKTEKNPTHSNYKIDKQNTKKQLKQKMDCCLGCQFCLEIRGAFNCNISDVSFDRVNILK